MRRPVPSPAVLLALVGLAGLGASAALAQQTPAAACLSEHASELSDACKARLPAPGA